ncbi:hypothetical protein E2P81_ATG03703 [Venturia nashicola]|uniref:DUF7702 domain-containing protein n=1 Tax=Venturia nashicola TaxID=86259 RepID=A0A4Z1PJX1_9PEZI|nr:hypothetical protein E6O75_ATG03779 [Venturia nashicola]TLD38028.1 hypothetical protein E2P81_ATG03703 [Venturia nashicola]
MSATAAATTGLSSIQQLAAAQIAIYALLFLITLYVAYKHGAKGMMVWQMLVGLEVMAIVLAALHIAQDGNPRKYGAGVSFASSGIQALLCLTPIGLIYEVCLFIPTIGLWTNRLNLAIFHLIPLVGVILAQVFAAPKSHEDTGDHSPVNVSLAKTGFLLLLIDLILLMAEGTYLILFRIEDAANYNTCRQLRTLLYSMVAALPFGMIRLGHEVAYIFDPSQDRSLEIGAFTNIFFVAFLMPIAYTIPLVIGGFLTRNIAASTGFGLVREESRRAFNDDIELKDTSDELEEQQHNRRRDAAWL